MSTTIFAKENIGKGLIIFEDQDCYEIDDLSYLINDIDYYFEGLLFIIGFCLKKDDCFDLSASSFLLVLNRCSFIDLKAGLLLMCLF